MTIGDFFTTPQNWVFLLIALPMLYAAYKVTTTNNVVHAVLALVGALAGTAALFILLGAEFVAWTVVLISIGAVIVLFLFGIMITRAPIGQEVDLSHPRSVKIWAALASGALFIMFGAAMLDEFGDDVIPEAADATRTGELGLLIFERYVIPFEVVSLVLLAALIGGIVIARRDPAADQQPGVSL